MKVLGIDSATSACSAAICENGTLISKRYETMTRGQSEAMMPMIEEVFGESGLEARDLDLIAVTVGPGAFTGLRIAIATAVGISLASGVTVVGITTTEAIAYGAKQDSEMALGAIVALDSRRDDIYLQAFSSLGLAITPVKAIAMSDIKNWVSTLDHSGPFTLIGDASARAIGFFDHSSLVITQGAAIGVPDAKHVAALTAEKYTAGIRMLEPTPLYLRPPDAVVPKNGGRLRA